ncbi:MAG: YceD family protein [Gammaproteobacteria bacterium]|jgi:uncharacterized protein|nr:YceD family protein [Gammaproteobacteria bacterium]
MSPPLPDRVDPWRLAEGGKVLEGLVALAALPRLAPALAAGGDASYRLEFGREDGRAVVTGRVRAVLALRCQRCLGPLRLDVDSAFALAVVGSLEEVAALPERYEPAIAEDGWIRPRDLVEDELLLAVPAVPLHEQGACRAPATESGPGQEAAPADGPFAVLASLRRNGGAHEN